MKVHQQRHGAVTLLKPEGPLVEAAAEDFGRQAKAVATQSLGRVVIDMSVVPFVDSLGLETLLVLTEAMGDSGQVLKLCGTNKTVRQVMDLVEIDTLFDHFEDVNSAVRSFL